MVFRLLFLAILVLSSSATASICGLALTDNSVIGNRTVWMNNESVFVVIRGFKSTDANELEAYNLVFTSATTGKVVMEWPAIEWLRPHVSSLYGVQVHFEASHRGDPFFRVRVQHNRKVSNLVVWPERRFVANLTEQALARGKMILSQVHAEHRKTQAALSKADRIKSPWKQDPPTLHSVSSYQGYALYSVVLRNGSERQQHFFIESSLSQADLVRDFKIIPRAHWKKPSRDAVVSETGFLFEDHIVYTVFSDGQIEFRNVSDGKLSPEFGTLKITSPISGVDDYLLDRPISNRKVFSIFADTPNPIILVGMQSQAEVQRFFGYRLVPGHGWKYFEFPWPSSENSTSTPVRAVFDQSGRYLMIDRVVVQPHSRAICVVDLSIDFSTSKEIPSVLAPRWISGVSLAQRPGDAAREHYDAIETLPGKVLVERAPTEAEARQSQSASWDRRKLKFPKPGFAARFQYLDLATGVQSDVPSEIAQDGSASIQIVGGSRVGEFYFSNGSAVERIP